MIRTLCTLLLLVLAAVAAGDTNYKGKWSSSNNSLGGDIRIQLEGDGALTFTIEGYEIKAKVTEWNVAQNYGEERKFRIAYAFSLQDTPMLSTATGIIKGNKLEGKYVTTTEADKTAVDEGTFTATN